MSLDFVMNGVTFSGLLGYTLLIALASFSAGMIIGGERAHTPASTANKGEGE